jgi:hypothetical protein
MKRGERHNEGRIEDLQCRGCGTRLLLVPAEVEQHAPVTCPVCAGEAGLRDGRALIAFDPSGNDGR